MNLKFWKKEKEPSIMDFVNIIKYAASEEFQTIYKNSTPEEQKILEKKIAIVFDCIGEYKDALEYEISSRELEETKDKWSKP